MSRKILMTSVATLTALAFGASGTLADVTSKDLRNAVTVKGIRVHQKELQDIANANGGTRASGTPGYMASLEYVKKKAIAAGYKVTVQPFDFAFFTENSPSKLRQVAPNPVTYVNATDFLTMDYSGPGDVTAVVQPAGGIIIPPTQLSSSASGCAAADFNGFVPGNIALIQRGTCTFFDKATNAAAAGAAGVIIFNEGNPGQPDRIPLFGGTLGTPVDVPVLSVSFAFGRTLYNASQGTRRVTLRMQTNTISQIRPTANLFAETPGGRNDRVVVVGAHLDSVLAGPGINDNGSGTAGILEIAESMAYIGVNPVNKVRFAWWGAEESGLLGSAYYVSNLTPRQLGNISLNLNFDMIGSPNFVRQIYDGDGSDTDTAGPTGSGRIERVFERYFTNQGLTFEATAFDGRSDYGPFIDVGIPAGGLFTGAEDIKTPEQQAKFGGVAGQPLDPCYHLACDRFSNNNNVALDQMSDATAHAVFHFAMTATDVGGAVAPAESPTTSVDLDSLAYRGSHLQR